jgi:hypothetical protein
MLNIIFLIEVYMNNDFDTDDFIGEIEDISFDNENKTILNCEHSLTFKHPGFGRYDVYYCEKCKNHINKMWNETGTTTYKDRV